MQRSIVLYLATFLVLLPLDLIFLGFVAKGIFQSHVGDMLGEVRIAPAVMFYLLYIVGILIFVSGGAGATTQSALLYGALFGFFCYITFELTSMALLKNWSWTVVVIDVTWGTFVTAISAAAGLWLANWVAPRLS